MFKRSTVFGYCILIIAILLVVFQYLNIKRVEKNLIMSLSQQKRLERYIVSSFNVTWRQEEVEAIGISLSMLTDSCYVIYLPMGLCRSCFTSLLFAFQDNNIDYKNVTVLSEANDFEVKSICSARGVGYYALEYSLGGLNDIIVSRLYQGHYPLSMKYNLERNEILSLFLSNDNKNLSSIIESD